MIRSYLLLALLSCAGLSLHAQPKGGESVPPIALTDINGKNQSLASYEGKIVLVDFWASWCAPCRKSNRELTAVYEKYNSRGFEIFGISLDKNADDWKKAVAADKIKWLQVTESGGWDAPTALAWKVEQLPSSFLLGKDGKVLAINPSKNEIEAILKKQLL